MKPPKAGEFGVIVQTRNMEFIAIPEGRSLVIGYGRLYVKARNGKDIAIFEPGEWRFGAYCHRDSLVLAPSATEAERMQEELAR